MRGATKLGIVIAKMKWIFTVAMLGGLFLTACSDEPDLAKGEVMKLQVTSAAFSEGETIPQKFTCDGADVSPPLSWTRSPQSAKSIALICEDSDAPMGIFTHWVIYDLPPDTIVLDENVPKTTTLPNGAKQGVNSFNKIGYNGPCPPPGKPHRYFFKVYALDAQIELPPDATKRDLLAAMKNHVVAEGELMGTFGR